MRTPNRSSLRCASRALSLCAALSCTAAFAGGPTAWAVLSGGGRDASEGAAALQAVESAVVGGQLHLGFAERYPSVVRSDDVQGMSAGLHVAVLGVCATERDALDARDAARQVFPGAYVRPIQGGLAVGCPTPLAVPVEAMLGPTVAVVAPRDRLGLQLRVLHSPTAREGRCPADSLWVELAREREQGPALVHHRVAFEGACRTERRGQVSTVSHLYQRSIDGPEGKVHLLQALTATRGGKSQARLHGVWVCGGELRARSLAECTGLAGAPCGFEVSEELRVTTFAGCAPGKVPSAGSCAEYATTPIRLEGCALVTAKRAETRAAP